MDDFWRPRCNPPGALTRPVPVDPHGLVGPTPNQARGPRWRRTSPGLYVPASVDRDLVEQHILEQAQRLPTGGAVTGWAALRLHGGGFFGGRAPDRAFLPVPVVLPPGRDLRRVPEITVRRERLPESDVTERYGTVCTTPLRATFDEMRRQPDVRKAVTVLDMSLAGSLVGLGDFRRFLDGRVGWSQVQQVRSALALAVPGAQSPQETVLRLIWELDAGLPRPRCNVAIADLEGNWAGRPDLLCEELGVVGEYDGALHRDRERHRRDVGRQDRFRRCGLETFTVVGADLGNVPLVVERMQAAVARARRADLPRAWMTRR